MKRAYLGLLVIAMVSQFAFAAESSGVKVDVLAKSTLSWDGNVLPNYPVGKPEITILKIAIAPKTTLPLHQHPLINAGVLLKGTLTVITEDKKVLYLKAGEALIEVVDKWHYGVNEGEETAEIVVFYAGVQGQALSQTKAP